MCNVEYTCHACGENTWLVTPPRERFALCPLCNIPAMVPVIHNKERAKAEPQRTYYNDLVERAVKEQKKKEAGAAKQKALQDAKAAKAEKKDSKNARKQR